MQSGRGVNDVRHVVSDMHLSADLWKLVSSFCLENHELRTVYNIAQDLGSLQSVCKASARCAENQWSSVAKLCDKHHAKYVRSKGRHSTLRDHLKKQRVVVTNSKLSKAAKLPPDLLTVYIQVQSDKARTMKLLKAAHAYHLIPEDLTRFREVQTKPRNNKPKDEKQSQWRPVDSHSSKVY